MPMLTFQHCKAMVMALHLPVTPGQGDTGFWTALYASYSPVAQHRRASRGRSLAPSNLVSRCAGCRWRIRCVKSCATSTTSACCFR